MRKRVRKSVPRPALRWVRGSSLTYLRALAILLVLPHGRADYPISSSSSLWDGDLCSVVLGNPRRPSRFVAPHRQFLFVVALSLHETGVRMSYHGRSFHMSRLALHLLGPPRVERDGEPVRIAGRKALALLAYLAVTGRNHRRETLATLLWPELDHSRARAELRRALSTLRRTLGDICLRVDQGTVELSPDQDVWLDVGELRRQLVACNAHGHPAEEVCADCVPLLQKAGELFEGDFLEGFTLRDSAEFDEWQFFETEGLRDQLANVLQRLVHWHSSQGSYDEAIVYARRRLSLDPLRESSHRELMRLYAQARQRAAALRQYRECERVLDEELGVAPSEETTTLYEQIRTRPEERETPTAAPATPQPRHNLPARLTTFIGREAILSAIVERLEDPVCRLLTLVGPGGGGKTRLALEAGAAQLASFEDGVFFVSLAPLRSVESIEPAAATALGLSLSGAGDPREQLLAYLRRKHLLLILDNFEHLLDGVELVVDVLEAAPNVKVLATSRARLKVEGEQPFPVAGMNYPQLLSSMSVDVGQFSALKLFLGRARRAQPGFELTDGNLPEVVRICRLVGGMPLGIVLAAAWIEILSPAEIADEIEQSLDFLETDLRAVPERQRSMRAVFDHSWSLLTERQREVCQALSVFRGGFTRQAAQRVVGATLRELKALVDRSLVQRSPAGRYEMHELLRQYAEDKLVASPAASEEAHDGHCGYYIAALERWDTDRKGPRMPGAYAGMTSEIDNLRAAWNFAVERGQAKRLSASTMGLYMFYWLSGYHRDSEAAFEAAAKRLNGMHSPDALRALAKMLSVRGFMSQAVAPIEARHCVEQALELLGSPALEGQDTREERAIVLWAMAAVAGTGGDSLLATRLTEQRLALCRELGDKAEIARALGGLGFAASKRRDYDEASKRFEESIPASHAIGDMRGIGVVYDLSGIVAMKRGQLAEAIEYFEKAIPILWETHDVPTLLEVDSLLASALALAGKFERARPALERSLAAFGHTENTEACSNKAALGWVEMHLGQYGRARAHAETALALGRGFDDGDTIVQSLYFLGCVALAEAELHAVGTKAWVTNRPGAREAYAQARRLSQECVARCQEGVDPGLMIWPLSTLAAAERRLGNLDRAGQHLAEALQLCVDTGAHLFWLPLGPLPMIALLLADAGEHERAVELYALASRYPYVANSRWFEDVFGRHIDAVAATLPPDVAEAARERGRARDLQATVKELLAELEGWDA